MASVLFEGEKEVILIDAQFRKEDAEQVADLIKGLCLDSSIKILFQIIHSIAIYCIYLHHERELYK